MRGVQLKISIRKNDIWLLFMIMSVMNVFSSLSICVEIVSIALILMGSFSRGHLLRRNYYFYWMFLFLSYSILSAGWSLNSISVLYGCRGLIECLLIGLAVHAYLSDEINKISFWKIYIFSASILLLKIVITTPLESIRVRVLSGGLNANVVGLELAIAVLSVVFLIKEKYIHSRKYLILLLFFCAGIVISGSKKAIIALVVGVAMYKILYSRNILSTLGRIISLCIVLYIIYYLCMNVNELYEIVGRRFEGMVKAFTLGKNYGDASTFERLTVVEYAIGMWKKNPIWGYGLNSFEQVAPFGIYTHCNYVELLFGVGVLGTVLFYSLYVWMVKNVLKFFRTNKMFIFMFACIVIFLISDIGYVSYGDVFYHLIIVFICEMIAKTQTYKKLN